MKKYKIPNATYRLQFNGEFTFSKAKEIVSYLKTLGISHVYSSPLLQARGGSSHGYDVVNPEALNNEIGTEEQFEQFVESLKKQQMGLIVDIVPNHMFILDPNNKWWFDVLENGPSSPYADYFDIDWNPPRQELKNKVLLPLLDRNYGSALEEQAIEVIFQDGIFSVKLSDLVLPTDPSSWNIILEPIAKEAEASFPDDPDSLELKSIQTAVQHLPSPKEKDPDKIEERLREKEVIKRRLKILFEKSDLIATAITKSLEQLNGKKGDSHSFDQLEEFLNVQPYRLCFWRVANDEINFRRFFEIFEFAGIRTEKPEVFEKIHSYIFELVQRGYIDGIRIDHIDGLWDPVSYLETLQEHLTAKKGSSIANKGELFYVIAEKILTGNETLRRDWLLQGTVGYDFLNNLNGIFVYQTNKKPIQHLYRDFTGFFSTILDLMHSCKKLILLLGLSSEHHVLSRHLDQISEQHRSSRDFTAESLRGALRDVIACFPVYRSYIRAGIEPVQEEDKKYILTAISRAKRMNPAIETSIFDFIQTILLLEHPEGLTEDQKKVRENFVMRFQQLTGPVMAKGLEDTAFYRYYPLSSINEVGGDLASFGITIENFHTKNLERLEFWPHTMLATSTHDTKRSEDVRARINVLSEIPEEWKDAILRWSKLNEKCKIQEDENTIPDANEEYLLYQTLVGSWPVYPMDTAAHLKYLRRIQNYMEKAIKEAKIHTSWINPNKEHDTGVSQFIEKILGLDVGNAFLEDFKQFVPKIIYAGMLNSLSQVLLKFTSPGVPDIYQGNEIWEFNLVDPDNRGPIDFGNRQYLLQTLVDKEINRDVLKQLLDAPEDGRIKMYVSQKILTFREKQPDLFKDSNYVPLKVEGEKHNHVVAFARILKDKIAISVATRFFTSLITTKLEIDPLSWKDTFITLPSQVTTTTFKDILTGQRVVAENKKISLEKLLNSLSIALLVNNE